MSSLMQDLAPLSKAIGLRAYRQQVLASNIANADTPQYKARDFDFQSAMQKAMAGQVSGAGLALATTTKGHIDGGSAAPAALQFRATTQSAVDGNTVDMDVERAAMAENSMSYEILTTLISDKFKGMRAALAGTNG